MGRAQLYIPGAEAVTDCTGFNPDDIFHERIYKKHQITYQEICDVYEPMGYSEFKISGRIRMVGAILRTVPYLIKPEYQLDVYLQLFQCYSDFDILPQFD